MPVSLVASLSSSSSLSSCGGGDDFTRDLKEAHKKKSLSLRVLSCLFPSALSLFLNFVSLSPSRPSLFLCFLRFLLCGSRNVKKETGSGKGRKNKGGGREKGKRNVFVVVVLFCFPSRGNQTNRESRAMEGASSKNCSSVDGDGRGKKRFGEKGKKGGGGDDSKLFKVLVSKDNFLFVLTEPQQSCSL